MIYECIAHTLCGCLFVSVCLSASLCICLCRCMMRNVFVGAVCGHFQKDNIFENLRVMSRVTSYILHPHVYTRSHVVRKQANHVYAFTHHDNIRADARAICIHLHNRHTYICTHMHAKKNTNSLLGIDFLMYR